VNEQGDASSCVRKLLAEAVAVESQGVGSRPQGHGDSQCGSLIGESIAEEPVNDGERVVAPTWQGHEQAKKPTGVGKYPTAVAIDLILGQGPIVDHEPNLRSLQDWLASEIDEPPERKGSRATASPWKASRRLDHDAFWS
jgi:hypothetical protein